MADLAEIQRIVEDLTGGGDHLAIEVTASQFTGKRLIDQHRMIHAALQHKLAPVSGEIHALQIKTLVP